MYGSNSWELPAGHVMAFFREARQYFEDCPECREKVMEDIRRDFPWLATMLQNDLAHPDELVLR